MLASGHPSDIAEMVSRMHHRNQHHNLPLFGVLTIAMLAGLISGSRRVHAQALDKWDSVTAETSGASVASNDTITAKVADVSAVPAASDDSDMEYALSDAGLASTAPVGEPVPGSENGQVLEIPRVIDSSIDIGDDRASDASIANAASNDDDAAQSQGDQEAAESQDFAGLPDQVGTLQDYESQAAGPPLGVIVSAPGLTVLPFTGRPPGFNPSVMPRTPMIGGTMLTPPIILPPTSVGPFPSTSPMLMAPRFVTPGRAFPAGGWMRARR